MPVLLLLWPIFTGALALPGVTPADGVPVDEDAAPGVALLSCDSVVAQP
jgi:hypothetical protein